MSRTSVYLLVLGVAVVGTGAIVERLLRVATTAPPPRAHAERHPPPLAPSSQVVAFVADLKQLPALALLEEQAPCTGAGKPRRRPRHCSYRAGDVEVTVGYDRDDGRLRVVDFIKRHLDDAPPLPWSDLATVIPKVCPEVSAAQAVATATEGAGKYLATPWASHTGLTLERPKVEVARRELRLHPDRHCDIVLIEQIDRGQDYSNLYVRSVTRAEAQDGQKGGHEPADETH